MKSKNRRDIGAHSKHLYSAQWQKHAMIWRMVTPPWRPSLREVVFCDEILKELKRKKRNLKALLLGATPELRDMFHMNGISLTLLDINSVMYDAMTQLRYYAPLGERLVVGQWLDMARMFKRHSFDIVVGDCTQDNIPFRQWKDLWHALHTVVKADGVVLLGVTNTDFTKNQISLRHMFEAFKQDPLLFQYHHSHVMFMYRIAVECGAYDFDTFEVNHRLLRKNFIQLEKKYGIPRKNLEQMWLIPGDLKGSLFPDFIEVFPPFRVTRKSLTDAGFRIRKVFSDTSDPNLNMHRYVCLTKI